MRRLIAWVLLILPLAACGNKGSLLRPSTPAVHRPVVSSSAPAPSSTQPTRHP